ncbi:MAG: alpha/beta hydrolase [Clostridiales bacterium]|nr:alpha/beta hydrolase [Clostridiales bacterium]
MKIEEFGDSRNKKIVLIPGTMMCWKQFSDVIPLLQNDYHILAVSTDGFDGNLDSTFTTAEASAHKLAEELRERGIEEVELVFGESFGSATTAVIFNSQEIKVKSIIMNGPQYFDFGFLTRPIASIIPKNQYRFLGKMDKAQKKGKIPLMLKLFTRSSDENMLGMFAKMPGNISYETLRNCTEEGISLYNSMSEFDVRPDAKVSVWHGQKEPNMKKAVLAIRKIYPNMEDHPFEGMGHGEVIAHPTIMSDEIRKFILK